MNLNILDLGSKCHKQSVNQCDQMQSHFHLGRRLYVQDLCELEHVDHEAMQGGIIFVDLNALSLGNFV